MSTLTSNSVVFPSSTLYDGDITAIKKISSNVTGLWAWGHNTWAQSTDYGAAQVSRGVYYVSRQIYGTTTLRDGYNNPYTGTGLYYPSNSVTSSYDSLSYTNTSVGRSIKVEIQLNIGRSTDDATNSIVFRGGSPNAGKPAVSTGHTGGTQIYTTGGTTGTYFTYIDTIPANTTYTYWHYCGITGGSGGDGCTAWMNIAFYSF